MGGVCTSVSSFVSIALDALERISLCTVCAALTCCVLFTILSVMIIGIGIGYHYCFVEHAVAKMGAQAEAAAKTMGSDPARRGNVMRSMGKAMHRGFVHRMARREADSPPPSNNLTLSNNFTDTNNMYNVTETDNIYNFTETDNIYNFTETDDVNNFTVILSTVNLN